MPTSSIQLFKASSHMSKYWFQFSFGLKKYSISICSNSRVRKVKLPGVISLRKALPIWAPLNHLLYFAFLRTAGYVGCALGLGSGFLAGCALELLAFVFVGNFFCVHSTLIPAYFAIN